MNGLKLHKKVQVPSPYTLRMCDALQKHGDSIHAMHPDHYRLIQLTLSSDNKEDLFEAVLVAENYLAYNGSWDFHRKPYKSGEIYMCDIIFKWNMSLIILDKYRYMKLPAGVSGSWKLEI